MGRQVELPGPPQRIISIVPSQTELLFHLGLDEEVVGITRFCVHPMEQFKVKPKVGGTKKLDFDKIAQLNPDLIIGNKEENAQEQIIELEKQYSLWMSDISNYADAVEMIKQIGLICGRAGEAGALASQIHLDFSNFEQASSGINSRRVAYIIWQNPLMVAASNTYIHSSLGLCKFDNVFGQLEKYPKISEEDLQEAKPELILLSSEPYPFKDKHIEYFKKLCPSANVLLVDGEAFSWYGSRMLRAPVYFRELLERVGIRNAGMRE